MRIERIEGVGYVLFGAAGPIAYGSLDAIGEVIGETLQTCDGHGTGETVVCVCGCCWTDSN